MLRTVCDLTYVRLTGLTLVLVAMILSPADANAIPESAAPKGPLVDNPNLYQQEPPNLWEEYLPDQSNHPICYIGYYQCLLSRAENPTRAAELREEQIRIMTELYQLEDEILELEREQEACRHDITSPNGNSPALNNDLRQQHNNPDGACHLDTFMPLDKLKEARARLYEKLFELHHEILFTHGDPRYDATGNRIQTCLSTFQICEAQEDSESFYGDSYFVQSTPALFSTPHPQPPAVAHSNTDDQSTQNPITYPIRSTSYSDDAHL